MTLYELNLYLEKYVPNEQVWGFLKLAYKSNDWTLNPGDIVAACERAGVETDSEVVIGAVVAVTLCEMYGKEGLGETADWKRHPEISFKEINIVVVGGLLDVLYADQRGLDSPLALFSLVEPNGIETNIHPVVRRTLQR